MQNKKINFRSLTYTLAFAFLIVGILVLLIASGLNMYFSIQAQQKVIASQQQLIAKEAATTVGNFIQEKFSMMATAVNVGNLANIQQDENKLVMEKLIGREPAFRQLMLLDENGQKLVLVSRLSEIVSGRFNENESAILSQTEQGKNYIGDVYIDKATSEPLVVMAVPVRNALGDFKGVLMAEVNLKFMWNLIDTIKVGNSGFAYVVDRQGNLIAFSDVSRVLKGENLAYLYEVNEFVRGNVSAHITDVNESKGITGLQVVSSHEYLGTPDWAVIVELPVSEAYDPVMQQFWFMLFIIVVNVGFAVLAGVYLSRRITSPVKKLRDAAIKIGEGNLDTKIEIKSKDEIGELASEFSNMMKKLKGYKSKLEEYSADLEKQVAERTAELEKSKKALEKNISELERFNKLSVGRELKMIELKKKIKELEEKLQGKNRGDS